MQAHQSPTTAAPYTVRRPGAQYAGVADPVGFGTEPALATGLTFVRRVSALEADVLVFDPAALLSRDLWSHELRWGR